MRSSLSKTETAGPTERTEPNLTETDNQTENKTLQTERKICDRTANYSLLLTVRRNILFEQNFRHFKICGLYLTFCSITNKC